MGRAAVGRGRSSCTREPPRSILLGDRGCCSKASAQQLGLGTNPLATLAEAQRVPRARGHP